MWIFIAQCPARGRRRESIYWLVKKELSEADSSQRQKVWWDTKKAAKCLQFFIRLWISSDHVPLLKLNALGTVLLTCSHLIVPHHIPPFIDTSYLSLLHWYPLHTNQTIDKSTPGQGSLCETDFYLSLLFPVHLPVSVCLSGSCSKVPGGEGGQW